MILFGASGHAKVILDILEKQGVKVDFLVDDNPEIKELQSYEVRDKNDFVASSGHEVIVSIGSNKVRKAIVKILNTDFGWAIHPSAILADDVVIGQGTVIMAGAIVNSSSNIGNHCIINTKSSIDHDCQLMDYVHISPNATLCGGIKVGEGTQVGAGATIIPNLTIGKWTTIGAGSVIVNDVPDHAVVIGNPGRIIKYNDPEI